MNYANHGKIDLSEIFIKFYLTKKKQFCSLMRKEETFHKWGGDMLIEYLAILIYIAIAVAFALFAIVASSLLGQRKPTAIKQSPYECGMNTIGPTYGRVPIKYYIIAMLFLLFDIEVVFLYPWAVVFKDLKTFGFISMIVFIGIFILAYIYIWKKGALEWE